MTRDVSDALRGIAQQIGRSGQVLDVACCHCEQVAAVDIVLWTDVLKAHSAERNMRDRIVGVGHTVVTSGLGGDKLGECGIAYTRRTVCILALG